VASGLSAHEFVDAIRSVVGHDSVVALHEPDITAVEHAFVTECLDSTFVSSVGIFVNRFEEEIAAFTGASVAVAVANGTSALQVALVLAGVQQGDEVLIPALSFVATANAVVHAGGIPHFVDSDPVTMGMSADALVQILSTFDRRGLELVNPQTGRRVAAIAPMHAMGHPLEIQRIVALAQDAGIPVVEDAAESLGSYVGKQHTGTFGLLGILSFNGNKTITTGGGGMILTNDVEIGRRAKHLTTTAKVPHPWLFAHDETAWNFRMPNLNAALGVAQMTRLPQFLREKRVIAEAYQKAFAGVEGLSFLEEPAGTTSNYWLCSVALDEGREHERDEFLRVTNDAGIQCRPLWELLSDLPMYQTNPHGDLTTAHSLQRRVISMPSSPKLGRALAVGKS